MYFCFSGAVIVEAVVAPTPNHVRLDNIFETNLGVSGNSASVQDGVVKITNDLSNELGAVWSTPNNMLDFTKDFRAVMHINQGDRGYGAADGLVFVIQGLSNQVKWFTHSGAAMGALGENHYNGALGIPNSIGIEFDLYGNDGPAGGYFDKGITSIYNNNHVAVVYPGIASGYLDNWSLFGSTRNVVHHDLMNNINLAGGQWTRFELNWIVEEGILTAKVGNNESITIDPEYLNSQVFQNGTVSKAYWGFTGSTGPSNFAKQQVVFEEVPGLVEAETSISLADQEGVAIGEGSSVYGTSVLNTTVTANWLGGKQNWEDIISEIELPPSLEVVPNTTKINGLDRSDDAWDGRILSTTLGDIPNLGTFSGNTLVKVEITFDVKVLNESLSGQKITEKFFGSNFFNEDGYFEFSVIKTLPEAFIISPDPESIFLEGEFNNLYFDFMWRDPERSTIEQVIEYNQNGVSTTVHNSVEDTSSGEGNFLYDFYNDFKELDYGSFEMNYRIQAANGEKACYNSTYYKQFRPQITINEKDEVPSYQIGLPINIQVEVEDRDSTSLSLYIQVDNGDFQKVTEVSHNTEAKTIIDHSIDTANFDPGYHTINAYVVDIEGNDSTTESLSNIIVEGYLKISDFPESFGLDGLKISNSEIKIADFGRIAILDQRILSRGWSLSAQLVEGRFTSGDTGNGQHKARKDFFFYRDGIKDIVIADIPAIIAKDNSEFTLEEVVIDQDEDKGFYFNTSSDMVFGTYKATVNWTIGYMPE